jgi:hypothetical protein
VTICVQPFILGRRLQLARFRLLHLRDIKARATAVTAMVNRKLVSDLSRIMAKNGRLAEG